MKKKLLFGFAISMLIAFSIHAQISIAPIKFPEEKVRCKCKPAGCLGGRWLSVRIPCGTGPTVACSDWTESVCGMNGGGGSSEGPELRKDTIDD